LTCGPNSASGQQLISIAAQYGANVAFPYFGQLPEDSIGNIAGAPYTNGSAIDTAATAMQATLNDPSGSFFALGFSGGASAMLSAGAGAGQYQNVSYYDPGLGLSQSLPEDANVFRGVGGISDAVNLTSEGGNSSAITQCGHDVSCAITNSPALQAALTKAQPCARPTVFLPTSLGFFTSLSPFNSSPFLYYLTIPILDGVNSSVSTSYGGTSIDGQPVQNPN
jgi:hypothetical protein